jgi:hypothetical protein
MHLEPRGHQKDSSDQMPRQRAHANVPYGSPGKPWPKLPVVPKKLNIRYTWDIWWPGEPEDDLHGFVTEKERDAFQRGEPGPFRRVLRNPARGPRDPAQVMAQTLLTDTSKTPVVDQDQLTRVLAEFNRKLEQFFYETRGRNKRAER